MPFRDHSGLDAKTLDAMAAAYDEACRILDIKASDPRAPALVAAIATAARAGERDPQKLRECGVSACSKPGQSQS
jgi:hypothetical protein